jgi:hypothetical protein
MAEDRRFLEGLVYKGHPFSVEDFIENTDKLMCWACTYINALQAENYCREYIASLSGKEPLNLYYVDICCIKHKRFDCRYLPPDK